MKALPKKQCINCKFLNTCWYPKSEREKTMIHNCQDYIAKETREGSGK